MHSPRAFHTFLAAALLCLPSAGAALVLTGLRCESQVNPQGIDAPQPALSWQLRSSQRSEGQTAYQVLVASTPTLLAAGTGDLWDSGKISGATHTQIPYAGTALTSSRRVHWKVRVWDSANAPSDWSEPGTWTMGLLSASDWTARWITPSTAATDVGSSLLRREFTAESGLVRAVIHVTGLGQYEMSVNGRRVGQDLFSPGWTKYDKTVLYDTHDITTMLQPGANAIGIMLGNGMYNVPSNNGRYTKYTGTVGPRKAIAQLRLEYANGTVQTVGTDANWKWLAGPVTFNTVFGGEDYDARREQAGWDAPGFNEASWQAVTATTGPGGALRGASYAAPPLRRQAEVFSPTPALVPTAASKVYDFVQNASNVPTLTVYGPAGATVRLSSAEVGSTDGNGSISQINNPSYSIYTLKGSTAANPETVTPRFVYIGYRYLKVDISGGATIVSLTSSPVHTSADAVGEFSCSKPLFNDIRRIIRWAQRSNLVSILTDCPHREKLGWLEQYYLHGPSLRYEFDLEVFFRKTYTDMADSQLSNGLVPDIAPEFTVFSDGFRDSPEWGSAFVLSPEQQYDFYGDLGSISRHYANIKRYVDYLTTRASNHIVSHGLGDWYDVGPSPPGYAQLTPTSLTATATYYADARALAAMAQRLGRTADASTYTTLAGNIRNAFNARFYNATSGNYSTDSQTANAMPLALGMVDSANRVKVANALVARVRQDGNSVTAGDIGHRYLLRALADIGRSDVIYDIHSKTSRPGYGYILSQGYTALTEGWDGSSSKNHFMLGHIMEWFYHDLAGIGSDPSAPGFQKIVIRPQIVGDVTWAKATYRSINGPITSDWNVSGSQFTLKVSVPPGATATVFVPTLGTPSGSLLVREGGTTVWQNGAPVNSVSGVTFDRVESGTQLQSATVWRIGSGDYTFTTELNLPPTGLTATPGEQQVSLAWSVSPGATAYNLKRATTSGGPYVTIASNFAATAFIDRSVVDGRTYHYVVSALAAGGESANSFEVSGSPIPPGNGGFEFPNISAFEYNPANATWTFSARSGSSGSGISANGSAFTSGNPAAPEGDQVAFLQSNATIGQRFPTVPGLTYTVRFSAAQRNGTNGGGQTWDLRLDGTTIASYAPPQSATAYAAYTATFIATASSHLLSFVGTNTRGGDNTIFLDNVRLTSGGAFGFEQPRITTYQYNPSEAGWAFNAQSGAYGSGISANGSAFTNANPSAPEGTQVAFLQGTATLARSFPTVAGISYRVTFAAAQRGNSNHAAQTWDLRRDGVTLASYAPPRSATAYADYTASFVATAATHTLTFAGTNAQGGDNTVFLDNVRLDATSPAAPAGLTATPGDGAITLDWPAVSGADTYSVKSATATGGPYSPLASGLIAPGFVHSGLADGVTRFYVATASNLDGESGNSGEASATTYTAIMKWRLANFGTLTASGQAADAADPDGDGLTNAQEFAAGTNPNAAASAFKITRLHETGGGWSVEFSTVSGRTYRLERSPTLQSGSWTVVRDQIAGTGGVVSIADPTPDSPRQRFYRAVLNP